VVFVFLSALLKPVTPAMKRVLFKPKKHNRISFIAALPERQLSLFGVYCNPSTGLLIKQSGDLKLLCALNVNLKGHCLIFLSAIYQLFIKYFNIK